MPSRRCAVTIIGAGSVGTSLAGVLPKTSFKIQRVISADGKSARALAGKFHSKESGALHDGWKEWEGIIFIAVPDDEIANVAVQLALMQESFRGSIVFHLSGALTSDILKPLKKKGAAVGSFHPLQTFPIRNDGRNVWKDIGIALEGDRNAVRAGERIARSLRARPFIIRSKEKTLYHIAAVFGSNYVVTLFSIVEELGRIAGLPRGKTVSIFAPLVRTTIANVERYSPKIALTGPIARGDVRTIRKHIAELSRRKMKDILSLYILLGYHTAHLAFQKKSRINVHARRLPHP